MQARTSNKMLWAGRIVSGAMAAFLVLDGVMHLTKIAPVVQAFEQLGWPIRMAVTLGVLELVCVAAYVYPRTSVLGAILLTGYLGGAVATHLRVGNPLFGETLFPVYVGILLWGGLWAREPRLRALIPFAGTAARRAESPNMHTPRVAVPAHR
jgi:hypothetical protein